VESNWVPGPIEEEESKNSMPEVKKAEEKIICCTSAGQYDAAKVGLEDEKGKIPYFETHDLINMEKVRKGIAAKKTHAFIADING